MTISTAVRYRLANKARVVFDNRRGQTLVLYPERGLALNNVATAIVGICASRPASVAEIVGALECRHPGTPSEVLERDVVAFLGELQARGLLRVET